MEFRKMSVGTKSYGTLTTNTSNASNAIPNVNFVDPSFWDDWRGQGK